MKNCKFKAILILLSVLSIALYSFKESTPKEASTINGNSNIYSTINGTVFGEMQSGVPAVTVYFANLNAAIDSIAISEGFILGTLISQDIIDEGSYGYSYIYRYKVIDSLFEETFCASTVPVKLLGTDFMEDFDAHIDGGPRNKFTCIGVNFDGCEPMDGDYSNCAYNENETPVCSKESGGGAGKLLIGMVILVVGQWLTN